MTFDRLKASLLRAETWGVAAPVELIETHISCVFLAGERAYKLKKPVDLGFVDFSTLERRKRFCEEELRLNRRLAPDLYLRVVPISGSEDHPALDGAGEPIDYVVEMQRFSQTQLLGEVERRGELSVDQVEELARQVADFHAGIPVAPSETPHGEAQQVRRPVEENFRHLLHDALPMSFQTRLRRLRAWSDAEHRRREDWFAMRKRVGKIRECHGDMHLGNMILQDDRIVIFDCIEFNDAFRWIDVISEVAFCAMDLEDRGHPELASRFLNAYLEATGDYDALRGLRYYLCYRAMVRSKVAWLRLEQHPDGDCERLREELESYVALAERYAFESRSGLILMHGVSGTGKSYGALRLVSALGAIRVRSDVERKRLAQDPSSSNEALYSQATTQLTYRCMADAAQAGIDGGRLMLMDATCLKQSQRAVLLEAGWARTVPVRLLNLSASMETLRARILARLAADTDPSDADLRVLEQQLATREPLTAEEEALAIDVDTDATGCWDRAVDELRPVFAPEDDRDDDSSEIPAESP